MKTHGTVSKLESGQLAELASAIVRQLPHVEGLGEVAQGWIENGAALRKALRKALVPKALEFKEGIFPTKVNYDLSVESLVANGKYDWKNNDITSKSFPTTRQGVVALNLELVHLNQVIISEEVLKELGKRGLRPAELHELLSFGIQYPNEQGKYPIVALGSVWRGWGGLGFVSCLGGDGDGRFLGLDYFGLGWFEVCRFLAVCES